MLFISSSFSFSMSTMFWRNFCFVCASSLIISICCSSNRDSDLGVTLPFGRRRLSTSAGECLEMVLSKWTTGTSPMENYWHDEKSPTLYLCLLLHQYLPYYYKRRRPPRIPPCIQKQWDHDLLCLNENSQAAISSRIQTHKHLPVLLLWSRVSLNWERRYEYFFRQASEVMLWSLSFSFSDKISQIWQQRAMSAGKKALRIRNIIFFTIPLVWLHFYWSTSSSFAEVQQMQLAIWPLPLGSDVQYLLMEYIYYKRNRNVTDRPWDA